MSTELPERNFSLNLRGCHLTIVASTYNEKFTDALVENCTEELAQIAPLLDVDVVRVPGAFEVPMMVKHVIEAPLRQGRPSAVIALGVILRGSTAHADLIGTAITEKLLDLSVDYMLPVIHEVLLLDSEEQAFARCIAAALNRGREAARAAVRMIEVKADLESQSHIAARSNRVNPTGSHF